MADRHNRVVEDHPWAAVSHDLADPLAHVGLVTLDSAGVTGSFMFVRALFCPLECVFDYLSALLAKMSFVAVWNMAVAMSVDTCHGHQGELILFQLAITELVCAGTVSHGSLSSRRSA